jgi:hypothetical protein
MVTSESDYLRDLWINNTCPFCKSVFDERDRVGSGKKRDGGFCSLLCYARYYQLDLRERARRIQKDSEPNQD